MYKQKDWKVKNLRKMKYDLQQYQVGDIVFLHDCLMDYTLIIRNGLNKKMVSFRPNNYKDQYLIIDKIKNTNEVGNLYLVNLDKDTTCWLLECDITK